MPYCMFLIFAYFIIYIIIIVIVIGMEIVRGLAIK